MAPTDGAATTTAPLPVLTVARFEEALALIERMVAQDKSVFIAHAQAYREEHRDKTLRPLNAVEAASVAAGFLDERLPEDRAAAFQAHEGLKAYDEPQPLEVLLAAGLSTAPAFLRAALRVTALIELPAQTFEQAREAGQLDAAVDQQAETLRALSLDEARTRAGAALEHFGAAAGVKPGEAMGLLGRSVWQALTQAMSEVNQSMLASASSWSTDSPASTDGPAAPFSTTPRTPTPSVS